MKVFYGFDNISHLGHTVCTVGSYDGVHLGHQRLLRECIAAAQRTNAQSVVLTFEPHPRIVLGRAEGLRLLTTLREKIDILDSLGVDNLVVIPFDEAFSKLSYRDFIEQYLLEKLHMRCMVIGYNHLFGRNNEGNYTLLEELRAHHGFELIRLEELRNEESKVSSTVIRHLIETGDIKGANRHLGRAYLIYNDCDPLKLLPPAGRYLATVDGQNIEIEFNEKGKIISSVELGEALFLL